MYVAVERSLGADGLVISHNFISSSLKSKNTKHSLCCGRTYLSNGLIKNAKIEANNVFDTFLPYLLKGIKVVGLEPSCILSFRDELPALLKNKNTELLKNNSFTFEELLAKQNKYLYDRIAQMNVKHSTV